ncbi:MAG: tRNA (adenosine(37)-N6)-threonylcarbamoyltransferase complex transferase subunit TsaD [Candidatus Pacebacteria bacterium]|nr:tRNA (adenosine(37)-N6)-threonylcarbamoyltransferase complex transferase subunit TsaD [Candidatus Paceibacterota bacterium]
MKILAIETSCDETAISIIEAKGGLKKPQFKILADTVISQINIHKEYGGVFPALAKREHVKNLLPILGETLKKAKMLSFEKNHKTQITNYKQNTKYKTQITKIKKILEREVEMVEPLLDFLKNNKIPKIDAIAVTQGPGLEPALWTGINFAKALALAWDKPFIPVNHMEGHLVASLLKLKVTSSKYKGVEFPALGLLISGGHTELIMVKDWMDYKLIGQTRDDAVGEAYDKVARMLGLPYPGGPEISKLSEEFSKNYSLPTTHYPLPRPMLHTNDFDFSFSGLKTAVLYTVKNIKNHAYRQAGMTPEIKKEICAEFENAVVDVLLFKTKKAVAKNNIKTLILGGGVTANKKIRKEFKKLEKELGIDVLVPDAKHSTDNAVMIGIAGYFRYLDNKVLLPNKTAKIRAEGNLAL